MTNEQTTDDKVYLAALAGLLHDIGEFAQRARWQAGEHTELGGEFVQQFVPPRWREGLYPVMSHHDNPLQGHATKVVALADRLSAGERKDEKQEQPKQLLSIFCRLETEGLGGQPQHAPQGRYLPLTALRLERKVLFPDAEASEADVVTAYKALWGDFEKEAATLSQVHHDAPADALPVYLENLQLLLQRYTWCVPSAYYRSLPDVGLYDHCRTTAALAACMVGKPESWLDDVLLAPDQSTAPAALLVGGDLSGVQAFIYTITARGATSALRGRSFYLQLLTEAVTRYVLRRLELPITNLIYQGGGNFYLLARPEDGERLADIQREISRVLLAHHRGDLYLALAGETLKAADFYDGCISDRWDVLAQQLRATKQRRFTELGKDRFADLFKPQGDGGNEDRMCQVCGQEHPGTQEVGPQGNRVRKCPPCRSYEVLGKDLREAVYLWLEQTEPTIPNTPLTVQPGGWQEVLAALGLRAGVTGHWRQVANNSDDLRVVLALNDDALGDLCPGSRTITGRRFLVNVTPAITQTEIEQYPGAVEEDQKPGDVKPFAVLEAQSAGIKRLGVLRMDVDNLGDLFAKGFVLRDDQGHEVERIATLSRVAALSFAVSLYFEGWVEHLAADSNRQSRNKGRGDTLYSIYSGGDDLFFVGAWDQVVELARHIRADLTPFAAGHPGIHASAGIVLVGGKYPLYQAAEDAGAAESQAKRRAGKDAITFLGQVVSWERFGLADCDHEGQDNVHALMHHLADLVRPESEEESGGLHALLRLLIRSQEQHDAAADQRRKQGEDLNRSGQEQTLWGPWMWRGYYSLKRMARRYKDKPKIQQAVGKLAEGLHQDDFRAIEWIGLAARWAELLVREST